MPDRTATPTGWRDAPPEVPDGPGDGLVGSRCPECGTAAYPPRDVCANCLGAVPVEVPLSTSGTLYTWSVVHVAPEGWPAPYVIGYVDLPEDVRLLAQVDVADPDRLRPDQPVAFDTLRSRPGGGGTAPVFRPADAGAGR